MLACPEEAVAVLPSLHARKQLLRRLQEEWPLQVVAEALQMSRLEVKPSLPGRSLQEVPAWSSLSQEEKAITLGKKNRTLRGKNLTDGYPGYY